MEEFLSTLDWGLAEVIKMSNVSTRLLLTGHLSVFGRNIDGMKKPRQGSQFQHEHRKVVCIQQRFITQKQNY
jgi:hypothetical protein